MKFEVIHFPQWIFLILVVLLHKSGAQKNCIDLVCKSKSSCDLKQCFIPDNSIVNVIDVTVYKRTKECDNRLGRNFAYLDNHIWTRGCCALKARVCYTFDPRLISTNVVTEFNTKADEWNQADDAADIMKMSTIMMEKARPGEGDLEERCTDLVCKSKLSCYLKQCPVSTRHDAMIINATVYKRTKECDYTLRRNFAYLDNHIWTRGCCALEANVCYIFDHRVITEYNITADEWNETDDAADIMKNSTMMMVEAKPEEIHAVYIDKDAYEKTNVDVLKVALPVGICLILVAVLGFVFRMKIKGLVSQFREPSYKRHDLSNPEYEINGPASENTASVKFDNLTDAMQTGQDHVQSGNKPAGGYEYVKPLPRKKLGGRTKEHPSKVAASSPMFKYHPELEEVHEEKANEMYDTTYQTFSDECFNTSYDNITGSDNSQIMTTPQVKFGGTAYDNAAI